MSKNEAAKDLMASESHLPRNMKSYDYYDYYDYPSPKSRGSFNRRQLKIGGSPLSGKKLKTSASQGVGAYSNVYGSYSSGYDDCDNGISVGLLLTAVLGIGVMFFTLFTKIQMITRRKKRGADGGIGIDSEGVETLVNTFHDVVYGGI